VRVPLGALHERADRRDGRTIVRTHHRCEDRRSSRLGQPNPSYRLGVPARQGCLEVRLRSDGRRSSPKHFIDRCRTCPRTGSHRR
jgi:hypothetical protein